MTDFATAILLRKCWENKLQSDLIDISFLNIYAQHAELHFPHFVGQEYRFWAHRGMWSDTIAVGKLDSQGKATLTLPDHLKDYRGMTQWQLSGGGGLTMIFAGGENFTVSCDDANPSEENIIYSNTPENNYLFDRYRRQQAILAKVDAVRMAMEAYKDNNELLPVLQAELQKQEQAYNDLQKETVASPLYAARFAQIVDVTRGLPPVLGKDMAGNNQLPKDFMLKEMDMQALYTSGHWLGVMHQFSQWYMNNEEEKKKYLSDMKILLQRTPSDEVYTALTDEIIATCERYNWYNDLVELAAFLPTDGRTDITKGRAAFLLSMIKVSNGQKAPKLTQGDLPTKKTILVFYDSDCGPCSEQMRELTRRYPDLQKQGYEVVSIAADTDKHQFENVDASYPWTQKYCDLQGIAGKDFQNYGVMRTPTFYVIEKGIVKGRYATVSECAD